MRGREEVKSKVDQIKVTATGLAFGAHSWALVALMVSSIKILVILDGHS